MVERAEKITTGATAMAKARFLKVTGATRELDQALIDRARQLAGLNLDPPVGFLVASDGASCV